MKARLNSSKKWTPFPEELKEQIRAAFLENFDIQLKNREVIVDGRIYPQELALRIGISNKGQLKHTNFEISTDYDKDKENVITKIYTCVDVAASMIADYFESNEEIEFPLYWTEYPFEETKVWLQFSTENSNLEAEADKLLGLVDENLVKDADKDQLETDEAMERAQILDEEELSQVRADFLKKKNQLH